MWTNLRQVQLETGLNELFLCELAAYVSLGKGLRLFGQEDALPPGTFAAKFEL